MHFFLCVTSPEPSLKRRFFFLVVAFERTPPFSVDVYWFSRCSLDVYFQFFPWYLLVDGFGGNMRSIFYSLDIGGVGCKTVLCTVREPLCFFLFFSFLCTTPMGCLPALSTFHN